MNILIVDDEANIRKTLSYCLETEGHNVIEAGGSSDAMKEAGERIFDLVFLDIRLGEESGLDLIPLLLAEQPWLKIAVITAYASIETAVEAMKLGAIDYIVKPFTPNQIRIIVQKISHVRRLETEVAILKERSTRFSPDLELISENTAMQLVIETARKAAVSDAIVLLRGESGTGKSVFAKFIHEWSPRASKLMSVVSCPAIPPDLLESELFGHIKGAFTGALKDNPGRISVCEGGTLFLDEIGDMAPHIQAKLLRFVQDKEYERLGETKTRKADVRILAATNSDLEERVKEGRFREDLFFRLNVISIDVPPLRERGEDIPSLAAGFLRHFCIVNHKSISGFTDDAMKFMTAYSWPGNIRELRNTIERAVILGNDDKIKLDDLSIASRVDEKKPVIGDKTPLSLIEEMHIRKIISSSSSLQEAAEILGIDQATLWRKRKKFSI